MRISLAFLIACMAGAAQAKDVCHLWPYESAAPPLSKALDWIAGLPATEDVVETYKPVLCVTTDASDAHGTFDPETGIIVLSGALDAGQTTAVLLHELRHLDRSLPDTCLSPELAMQDWTRAVFAMEADAMAVMMLDAWELAEAGTPQVWDAVTEMTETRDIALGFSTEMAASGDPALATAAAFAAWYGSDNRREEYYVSACETYLSRQEREKIMPGYGTLSQDFLNDICALPGGGAYPCSEPGQPLPR